LNLSAKKDKSRNMNIIDTIHTNYMLPPILYHYTSPACFSKIVEGRYLFASHLGFIKNDISFSYTVELVREELKRRIKSIKLPFKNKRQSGVQEKKIRLLKGFIKRLGSLEQFHIFVISFSLDGDMGSSWQNYCPGGIGFSMGFDAGCLDMLAKNQGFTLVECIHDASEQKKIIHSLVSESVETEKMDMNNDSEWLLAINTSADEFALNTVRLAAIFKHPSYHEKAEWRMFSMPVPILPTNSSIRFRKEGPALIPCQNFMLSNSISDVPFLKKTIIGPTPDKTLSSSSLELFLSVNALQSCIVEYSQIPHPKPF
jgi:hypothetical protein